MIVLLVGKLMKNIFLGTLERVEIEVCVCVCVYVCIYL